jgi:hypothetical protein
MMEQQFSHANQSPGAVVMQDTETVFNICEGNVTDQIEFGYRQLYLFALRHFPRMIGESPKKEKDRPKPTIEEPDPVTWYRFALLADRLQCRDDGLSSTHMPTNHIDVRLCGLASLLLALAVCSSVPGSVALGLSKSLSLERLFLRYCAAYELSRMANSWQPIGFCLSF